MLKDAGNRTVGITDFHSISSFSTMEVNGDQQLFGSTKILKISSFVFNKIVIFGWNNPLMLYVIFKRNRDLAF